MKIAIDLSVLQTDHRFRGIGSVVINFINHLSKEAKENNSFVFFVEEEDEDLAYEKLELENINYEIRHLKTKKYLQWPGKLNLIPKTIHKINGFIEYHTGDPRISKSQISDIDNFIQFDQNRKLPVNANKNTALFIHDIIPYILESDYLPTYSTARSKGRSVKGSVKCAFLRHQYISRIKINCKRSKTIIANSNHTKDDFVKFLNINEKKIRVAQLGVDKSSELKNTDHEFIEFKSTIWGPVEKKVDLTQKPFLLFIGGTDPRRRMIDLLAAFNNLKAREVDISIVLSGDAMDGLENLKNKQMKKYLENNTSYSDDTHLMGYITDSERDWLYRNALAFVFPSVYEGFGLPVLEAMSHGAPVITYNNTSIAEVGGNSVIYAKDYIDMIEIVEDLINNPNKRTSLSKKAQDRSAKFTWHNTSKAIIKAFEV